MVKWDDTVLNWLYQLLFSCFYRVKLNPHTMLGCVCFWRRGDLFVAPRWQGIAGSCTNQLPGQQAPQGLLSFRTCLLAPWPSKQGENPFLCACLHVYMCVCVHTIDTYIYIFMHIYSGLSVSNCLANLASLFLKSSVQSRRQTEERFELLKRIMEQQK